MELIAQRTLSESLKEATRLPHAELEKSMVDRLRKTGTPAAYASLLRLFYGFYKPLEDLVDNYIDKNYLTDYESRRKSAAIISDLAQLGDAHVGNICHKLPEIKNSCQALGALYVMEGSTLGGKIICNMLKKQMGPDAPTAFSFFEGYGDATGQMWVTFKSGLDNYTSNKEQQAELIDAATATFVTFKQWIQDNEQQPAR